MRAVLLLTILLWFSGPVASQNFHSNDGAASLFKRNRKFKSLSAVYFDDHRPCWVIGGGPNFFLSNVYHFDPDNGSQGTGVSESNFGVGILLSGGLNVPLVTINENAGFGINLVPSIYGGLGYIGFNAPVTAMFKYGTGATHYFTSDVCLGIGAGYGFHAVQYYDLYAYAYALGSPFIVFEFGYRPIVIRLEVFERRHKADVPLPNRGEFLEFGIHFLHYFEDRD